MTPPRRPLEPLESPLLTVRETTLRTPFPALVDAVRKAAVEHARRKIACPPRQALALPGGGTLLSMFAAAGDIAVHKLVCVVPGNPARGLPTLQGHVDVVDARDGTPRLRLDAPALTGRRTAAVSLVAIARFAPSPPASVLIVGTGAQALHHVMALRALHPQARIGILGRSHEATERFCAAHHFQGAHVRTHADAPTAATQAWATALHPVARVEDSDASVIITCTTSRTPVVALPASPARLLVAVGAFRPDMAEIHPATVRASQCVVDDPQGAPGEAGDLIGAGVDWSRIASLGAVLAGTAEIDPAQPVLFKSVGSAVWDLAAARVALAGSAAGDD